MSTLAADAEIFCNTNVNDLRLACADRSAVCFAKRTLREMKNLEKKDRQSRQETNSPSIADGGSDEHLASDNNQLLPSIPPVIPAFEHSVKRAALLGHAQFAEACTAWLTRSPSGETRSAYARELGQFLEFVGVARDRLDHLARIRPHQVAAWRDELAGRGLSNAAIVRKITVLRSLFSYLQTYGYAGANPAHSDFVAVPPVPRDGRTVALTPQDCRRLLESPDAETPVGVRDQALLAVLAYTGCRVGELTRLRVMDYKETGGHKVLEIRGKGGKERRVPLHPEAFERLQTWLAIGSGAADGATPLFQPPNSARGCQ